MGNVNHPAHYTDGPKCENCGAVIECITIARNFSFNLGNVIKYLWRAGRKENLLEDLKKAEWYIKDAIRQLESKSDRTQAEWEKANPGLVFAHKTYRDYVANKLRTDPGFIVYSNPARFDFVKWSPPF